MQYLEAIARLSRTSRAIERLGKIYKKKDPTYEPHHCSACYHKFLDWMAERGITNTTIAYSMIFDGEGGNPPAKCPNHTPLQKFDKTTPLFQTEQSGV